MSGNSRNDDVSEEGSSAIKKVSNGTASVQQERCQERKRAIQLAKQDLKRAQTTERQRLCRARQNAAKDVELSTTIGENSRGYDVKRFTRSSIQKPKSVETAAQRQQHCRQKKHILVTDQQELKREKNAERQKQCRKRKQQEQKDSEDAKVILLHKNAEKQKSLSYATKILFQ